MKVADKRVYFSLSARFKMTHARLLFLCLIIASTINTAYSGGSEGGGSDGGTGSTGGPKISRALASVDDKEASDLEHDEQMKAAASCLKRLKATKGNEELNAATIDSKLLDSKIAKGLEEQALKGKKIDMAHFPECISYAKQTNNTILLNYFPKNPADSSEAIDDKKQAPSSSK